MRVRRRDQLVCRWDSDALMVALPGQRRWLRVTPDLLNLLQRLDDFTDVDEIAAQFPGEAADAATQAVHKLRDAGILVADTDDAGTPPVWQHWGPIASRMHTEARDANYLVDSPQRDATATQIAADGAPPAPFKRYPDAPAVHLPRRTLPLRTPVEEVFAARRTHRAFAGTPVGIDALATVLSCTFAPQRFLDGGAFGPQQGRISASAGGRHEVECYVAVYDVTGVPAGLYHYAPEVHRLELLDATVDRERIAALAYEQEPSYQGAFTCLTTTVAARLSWKYRHPRAYRLWMFDAGHYGQTFALTCTALGLAPFQTVAFHDSGVEAMLGVDPDHEFATYLLSAGNPAPDDGTGPTGPGYPPPARLAASAHRSPADPPTGREQLG
ncbi:SagB-type dehydrogenase family enzyme [Micromonospora sp. M71_S20]|uniref:SagB/ThcOx family dehydrogenase n=1 Tax=Micromonospora sp. M71_S20 TaxID=592872 RepID=UPI000EB05FC8|nr:SagB/ThcOx family dehydrogenase [Micromonospora sp. M71_S20]RLK09892.1 SagB-type dehydrogenase family enzyme [Micromonospora sp. M71_S20]